MCVKKHFPIPSQFNVELDKATRANKRKADQGVVFAKKRTVRPSPATYGVS